MDLYVIDFETYYDSDYSLKKLTTHEYVHDPRFEAMSVAVMGADGETHSAVGHDAIADLLHSLPWGNAAMVGFNLKFDGSIAWHHFRVEPALYVDVMSLAAACIGGRLPRLSLKEVCAFLGIEAKTRAGALVDAKGKRLADLTSEEIEALRAYNEEDVRVTAQALRALFNKFPEWELPVLDWTIRACVKPMIHLDEKVLREEIEEEKREKRLLAREAGVAQSVLSSNPKFAEYLESLGVAPPMKVSPETGEKTWAFDKKSREFMELLNHPDERVRKAVRARLKVKSTIRETRAEKLLRLKKVKEPIPAPLMFSGAVNTHRFSGSDGLNFQNLPKDSRIRYAIRPPEGHKVVVCDSSQIELRMCHWLAGEEGVFEVLRAGGDPYCVFAEKLYGLPTNPGAYPKDSPEHKEHKRRRTMAKVALLALQYGMGWKTFQHTAWSWTGEWVPDDEARQVVGTYRSTYGRITRMWALMGAILNTAANGFEPEPPSMDMMRFPFGIEYEKAYLKLVLPGGLKLRYPDLRVDEDGITYLRRLNRPRDKQRKKVYAGLLVENMTQALAAQAIREQMRAIRHRLKRDFDLSANHMVLQVHDEIVVFSPESIANDVLAMMIEEMSRRPAWADDALLLAAEGDIAETYGDAK